MAGRAGGIGPLATRLGAANRRRAVEQTTDSETGMAGITKLAAILVHQRCKLRWLFYMAT